MINLQQFLNINRLERDEGILELTGAPDGRIIRLTLGDYADDWPCLASVADRRLILEVDPRELFCHYTLVPYIRYLFGNDMFSIDDLQEYVKHQHKNITEIDLDVEADTLNRVYIQLLAGEPKEDPDHRELGRHRLRWWIVKDFLNSIRTSANLARDDLD